MRIRTNAFMHVSDHGMVHPWHECTLEYQNQAAGHLGLFGLSIPITWQIAETNKFNKNYASKKNKNNHIVNVRRFNERWDLFETTPMSFSWQPWDQGFQFFPCDGLAGLHKLINLIKIMYLKHKIKIITW